MKVELKIEEMSSATLAVSLGDASVLVDGFDVGGGGADLSPTRRTVAADPQVSRSRPCGPFYGDGAPRVLRSLRRNAVPIATFSGGPTIFCDFL